MRSSFLFEMIGSVGKLNKAANGDGKNLFNTTTIVYEVRIFSFHPFSRSLIKFFARCQGLVHFTSFTVKISCFCDDFLEYSFSCHYENQ